MPVFTSLPHHTEVYTDYHIAILTTNVMHSLSSCHRFYLEDLGIFLGILSVKAVILRGSFLQRSSLTLLFIPFHFNFSPAQPSAFLMPLLMRWIFWFMQWKIFQNRDHWKQNGTAGGHIFAHLNDHFRNRTFFCFYCFWQHIVITPLYCPLGTSYLASCRHFHVVWTGSKRN